MNAGLFDELIVDNFAGGGGASMGIEDALGRSVDIAINHDPQAVEMHRANHPHTRHLCEDVWQVDPVEVTGGRRVGLVWLSPDCKHFSKAKGGKPVEKKIRGLAWVGVRWVKRKRPRVLVLENVEEFQDWGPLGPDKLPCPDRRGQTFKRFVTTLRNHGYEVDYRVLDAADYGAPTHRRRLFLIARCDGAPIAWPEPTHGPSRRAYRTAAECIDWHLSCPSIFLSHEEARQLGVKRPLAENSLRRIAMGIKRFIFESASPFIVTLNHAGHGFRGQSVDEPFKTVTGARDAHGLVTAFLTKYHGIKGGEVRGCVPSEPVRTLDTQNRYGVVAVHLTKLYGTSAHGATIQAPMPTVTANGQHIGMVYAFLTKYYATNIGQNVADPLQTVTSKHRFGIVTVHGEDRTISDVGMRMLIPRELARAQGFPDNYVLIGSKAAQVRAVGNSVCPPVAEAVVRANCADMANKRSKRRRAVVA